MDIKELRVEMVRYGDTQEDLADYLGVTRQTICSRLQEDDGSEFTLPQVRMIIKRYNLSALRVMEIFFASVMS